MTTNKLAIIGGSGLYDVEEFKDRELLDLESPWGKPSDNILKTKFNEKKLTEYIDGLKLKRKNYLPVIIEILILQSLYILYYV